MVLLERHEENRRLAQKYLHSLASIVLLNGLFQEPRSNIIYPRHVFISKKQVVHLEPRRVEAVRGVHLDDANQTRQLWPYISKLVELFNKVARICADHFVHVRNIFCTFEAQVALLELGEKHYYQHDNVDILFGILIHEVDQGLDRGPI